MQKHKILMLLAWFDPITTQLASLQFQLVEKQPMGHVQNLIIKIYVICTTEIKVRLYCYWSHSTTWPHAETAGNEVLLSLRHLSKDTVFVLLPLKALKKVSDVTTMYVV